jgi:uncharacterized membrane protein YoaK (UPF0700 family)
MGEYGPARLKWLGLVFGAALSANAGFVNAVFLGSLFNPVSHATGSLADVSAAVMAGDARGLILVAVVVLAFLGGAVAAGAMLARPLHRGRRYGTAMLLQAGMLASAPLVIAAEFLTAGATLGAAAAGLQNGMSSNYRGMTIRTSHMTGTLTDLGVFLGRRDHRTAGLWRVGLLIMTLVAFVTGGAIGAFWSGEVDIYALWASALCCALIGLGSVAYQHRQKSTVRA